jgi:hypothetical protein
LNLSFVPAGRGAEMAEALDSAGELVYRVELDRDDCRRGPFTESQFGREAVEPGLSRHLSPKPRPEGRISEPRAEWSGQPERNSVA